MKYIILALYVILFFLLLAHIKKNKFLKEGLYLADYDKVKFCRCNPCFNNIGGPNGYLAPDGSEPCPYMMNLFDMPPVAREA